MTTLAIILVIDVAILLSPIILDRLNDVSYQMTKAIITSLALALSLVGIGHGLALWVLEGLLGELLVFAIAVAGTTFFCD